MKTRIYLVSVEGGDARLVEATSRAQAERHVAAKFISATVATPMRIVGMMQNGGKVERANDDQDTATLPGVDEPNPAVIRSNRA